MTSSVKDGGTGKTNGGRSRSGRHRAREFALQGLYQWLLTGVSTETIVEQLSEASDFSKIDLEYFRIILSGAIASQTVLEAAIVPHLDRGVEALSPIERGILLLAGFELKQQIDVPYRVVINEAVELAKTFGSVDGYKYVNGVLDKLALDFREVEVQGRSSR